MAERRYTIVLYGALFVAVIATYGAYRMLGTMRDQTRVPTQSVVVAAKDVPEGATFDRLALTTRNWPIAAVPVGSFSSVDSVVGRVTRVAVFNGEPIVPGRLAPVGSSAGLEQKIAPGTRAMAVRINDVAGISGLLQPNSRVDVLVTIAEPGDKSGATDTQMAKLFMENMRVLSVGTEVQRDQDGKPNNATTVTLGVTPREAEELAVAMNKGSIQLVLRGYGDPDTVKTSGATSKDVLALLRGAPAVTVAPAQQHHQARQVARVAVAPVAVVPSKPAPPDSVTVSVYRGDKSTREKFQQASSAASSATGSAATTPKTP